MPEPEGMTDEQYEQYLEDRAREKMLSAMYDRIRREGFETSGWDPADDEYVYGCEDSDDSNDRSQLRRPRPTIEARKLARRSTRQGFNRQAIDKEEGCPRCARQSQ